MTLEFTNVLDASTVKLRSWHARCFSMNSPVSDIIICLMKFMGHGSDSDRSGRSKLGMTMEKCWWYHLYLVSRRIWGIVWLPCDYQMPTYTWGHISWGSLDSGCRGKFKPINKCKHNQCHNWWLERSGARSIWLQNSDPWEVKEGESAANDAARS